MAPVIAPGGLLVLCELRMHEVELLSADQRRHRNGNPLVRRAEPVADPFPGGPQRRRPLVSGEALVTMAAGLPGVGRVTQDIADGAAAPAAPPRWRRHRRLA